MPTRDFYTLPEAAQILDAPQRSLLKSLETGEIEGEQDPQSGRWKIPNKPRTNGYPPSPHPRSLQKSPEDNLPRCSGNS